MKVVSFNVRTWTRDISCKSEYNWIKRLKAIKKFIKDYNPDVICLQEALFPVDWIIRFMGYRFAGFSITHPILVRKNVFKVLKHKFRIHMDYAKVKFDRKTYDIFSIHSHWNKDILIKNCNQVNKFIETKNVIACGDWNNEVNTIKSLNILSLNSAREKLGIERQLTFENFTNPDKGEIDHFMCSNNINLINYQVVYENYGVSRMSDHYPIILQNN